jgi:hypothetical protein
MAAVDISDREAALLDETDGSHVRHEMSSPKREDSRGRMQGQSLSEVVCHCRLDRVKLHAFAVAEA